MQQNNQGRPVRALYDACIMVKLGGNENT